MARYTPDGGGGGSPVITGGPAFVAATKPGVALSQTSTATVTPPQATGAAVKQAPATLLVQPKPGLALVPFASATITPTEVTGVAQNTVLTLTPAEAAGSRIVQITYNLLQTNGATTATSGGSWSAPTNAQGLHNATNATNANTLTVAASGALLMVYAAQPNKTGLTITNVTLNGYWGNAAGVGGPCTYLLEYSINNGTTWTTLQTGSATVAAASPTTATDVTASIANTWANVAAFQVRATYTGAAGATASTLSVDAFELVVTANATQLP